jgi:hypothetical protein
MNGEITECQILGTSQVRAFSQGFDPAHQLLRRERLYEIVIATRLVAGNFVVESVPGGQENDWSLYPVFVAELMTCRQTVHNRHPHVHDDDGVFVAARQLDTTDAIEREIDIVAALAQEVRERSSEAGIVFYNKQRNFVAGTHGNSLSLVQCEF